MELLKILLGWPVVVAGIAITLFLRYDAEIRALMSRISSAESVEFPGLKLGKSKERRLSWILIDVTALSLKGCGEKSISWTCATLAA